MMSCCKLQELLNKVVKESEKKRITISWKKAAYIVINRRKSLRSKLRIGDVNRKQVQKFKYSVNV